MPQTNSQSYIFGSGYLTILLALLIRWCIALHSYSGEKTPPKYGDYEAQRHWMEITHNLDVRDWYKNTVDNNLAYWGLDYPPLTAYHSYICGFFASIFVPDSIVLHLSRGYESLNHKLFMRTTVIVSDLLIYLPALCWYFRSNFKSKDSYSANVSRFFALLYPGLIIVDYGHFQYNCVSLGLFVAAVAAVCDNHNIVAAFLFSLAVNYKQMELYHSLPFFVYFLGKFALLWRKKSFSSGITFLFLIASTVLVTFSVVWLPFLFHSEDAKLVFRRIFPVGRGLYEDKVSTFWCILNVFYKIRAVDDERMVIVCLATTLISVLPSLIDLFIRPSVEKFKLSLIICSFCFFLFSFHVHEKSILLVAIPVILDFSRQPMLSFWFLSMSTFSMLPLLIVDKLFLPYLAIFVFYCLGAVVLLAKYDARLISIGFGVKIRLKNVVVLSLSGCLLLSFVLKFCPNPTRYPYLWSLVVCSYSFAHFVLFLSYYYVRQCRNWIAVKKTRKD